MQRENTGIVCACFFRKRTPFGRMGNLDVMFSCIGLFAVLPIVFGTLPYSEMLTKTDSEAKKNARDDFAWGEPTKFVDKMCWSVAVVHKKYCKNVLLGEIIKTPQFPTSSPGFFLPVFWPGPQMLFFWNFFQHIHFFFCGSFVCPLYR